MLKKIFKFKYKIISNQLESYRTKIGYISFLKIDQLLPVSHVTYFNFLFNQILAEN